MSWCVLQSLDLNSNLPLTVRKRFCRNADNQNFRFFLKTLLFSLQTGYDAKNLYLYLFCVDTFFIQCIFYYKLPARIEKYYWKVISSRIPVTRPGFISFYLHAVKQSLNSKQNLRPREILSNDRHNLRGVYWIISCIALVPFCFLCGDTLKWVMRWDSAVDKIVWPQCMTGRW